MIGRIVLSHKRAIFADQKSLCFCLHRRPNRLRNRIRRNLGVRYGNPRQCARRLHSLHNFLWLIPFRWRRKLMFKMPQPPDVRPFRRNKQTDHRNNPKSEQKKSRNQLSRDRPLGPSLHRRDQILILNSSQHNTMRTLAIGDIHGCRTALETLIALVNPTPDDQLIFLGDYVNRGPDSRGVIGFLLKLAELRHCVFLRGNHEIMTMDARSDQSRASTMSPIGGRDLLRSYGFTGQSDWWNLIPPGHWQFFEHTARYFETDRHLFVHGSLDSHLDLAEQPDWI